MAVRFGRQVVGHFHRFLARAVVVNDGVAGNQVNPAFELCRVLKLTQPLLNLHENILQNVLCRSRVRHPRTDELTQLLGELVPDMFERCVHQCIAGFTASMLADAT
jgi:hypothetical protein